MSIFAIGDLHLPGGDKKPMDVFGAHWEHHFERICADWQNRVQEEDIVLIPRISAWAMQLSDALCDLREILQRCRGVSCCCAETMISGGLRSASFAPACLPRCTLYRTMRMTRARNVILRYAGMDDSADR